MADDDIPQEIVADTVKRLLAAIHFELSRYADAVSHGDSELRASINAAHLACINSAIMSLTIGHRAENQSLN